MRRGLRELTYEEREIERREKVYEEREIERI
jgi:hypothetical protein